MIDPSANAKSQQQLLKEEMLREIKDYFLVLDHNLNAVDLSQDDPSDFWLQNSQRFLNLNKIAFECRSKPATSAFTKRLFWNCTFDEFLRRFGLKRSAADPCIYYQHEEDHFTLVCIWVDEGLICSSNKTTLDAIYDYLSTRFKMRSASAETFVGLEIQHVRSKRTVYVSQPTYISKILARFSMTDCRTFDLIPFLCFICIFCIYFLFFCFSLLSCLSGGVENQQESALVVRCCLVALSLFIYFFFWCLLY